MRQLLSLILAIVLATGTVAADAPKKKLPAAKPIKDTAMQQLDTMIQNAAVDTTRTGWKTAVPRPEKLAFDPHHQYFARMVTNRGTLLIRFMPDVAPMHVTSFMYLTRLGFYDDLAFHRVITNFMAQGGDPAGNGTGGPGYEFDGEFSAGVRHDRPGLLSMANRGPGTDGSQFFLTFTPTPWLDGKHTIFGEVVEGMDVLHSLEAAGSPSGRTSQPLKMEKVTIEVR
ncbi:MAG: peptidylprolyl isomerase [Candidatus Eisenbacteria bacterium]